MHQVYTLPSGTDVVIHASTVPYPLPWCPTNFGTLPWLLYEGENTWGTIPFSSQLRCRSEFEADDVAGNVPIIGAGMFPPIPTCFGFR